MLDSQGNVAGTIAGPNINGPWGNMAVIDNGATATLFVSNTGFEVGAPDGTPPVLKLAKVFRLNLTIADGNPPVVAHETVVASGFGEQADKSVFIIGPTGLALGADDTLRVADAIGNHVNAIWPERTKRAESTDKDFGGVSENLHVLVSV